MSIRLLALLREPLDVAYTSKYVLIVLAERADDQGVTWVGAEAIERTTGMSRRAVFRALADLRRRALIQRERLDGREVWRLAIPDQSATQALVATVTSAYRSPPSAREAVASDCVAPEASVKHQEALRPAPLTLVPPAPKAEKGRRCRLPSDFILTDALRDYAASKGMPRNVVDREFDRFRNHHTAHGSVMASWPAAWRTWVGNFPQFNGGRRAASAEEMTYR